MSNKEVMIKSKHL